MFDEVQVTVNVPTSLYHRLEAIAIEQFSNPETLIIEFARKNVLAFDSEVMEIAKLIFESPAIAKVSNRFFTASEIRTASRMLRRYSSSQLIEALALMVEAGHLYEGSRTKKNKPTFRITKAYPNTSSAIDTAISMLRGKH